MNRSSLGIYHYNQVVGAIVLGCVLLFLGALVNAGLLKEWFQTPLTLRVVLPEGGVSGLEQGSEVQIMGTRAGAVRRIVIDPSEHMHAIARIDPQMKPFVRRNSQVTIRRQFGIAGAAYIEISRGTGGELDWEYAVLTAGTERGPTDSIGQTIEEVRARVLPILDEMHKAVANFNAVIDERGPLRQSLQSAASVAERIDRGEGSVGKLMTDQKMAADLQAVLSEAQSAIAHANGLLAELERSSKDARITAIIQRTDAILASLQTITRNVATASPQFGQITSNVATATESMPELLLQTEATARQLELLLGQLRRSWLLGGGGGTAPAASRRTPASGVRP
jgi:phospholipid/cholesterol/gamma-HCH transport system substrate-binding protein